MFLFMFCAIWVWAQEHWCSRFFRCFKLLEIQSLWTQSYQQPHTVSACIQLNSSGNMELPGRKPVPFWNYEKNSALMNSHDWQCLNKLKFLVSHKRRGVEMVMLYFMVYISILTASKSFSEHNGRYLSIVGCIWLVILFWIFLSTEVLLDSVFFVSLDTD